MNAHRYAMRTAFSVVVTAPKGIAQCHIPDWLLSMADGERLEIVVADALPGGPGGDRPGFRHLTFAGDHVFALRRKGLGQARNPWVILLEDHTIPMPGFLEAFDKMIAAHPEAALISGAVRNDTSTTPGSWAHFLYTAYRYWPQTRRKPTGASISLLAIRRDALSEDELAQDCAFETRLLPRLARGGRYLHCDDALVDHIQEDTLHNHCMAQYHNGRCHSVFMRRLGRSFASSLLAEAVWFAYAATARPVRIMFNIFGTPQFKAAHLPRMMMLGLAEGSGRLRGLWGDTGISPFRLD